MGKVLWENRKLCSVHHRVALVPLLIWAQHISNRQCSGQFTVFCLNKPSTLSTWLRILAIPRLLSKEKGTNWIFPLLKVEIANFAQHNNTFSSKVKIFRILQCLVKYLSDVHPRQAFDTEQTDHWGVIAIRTFKILWLLLREKVWVELEHATPLHSCHGVFIDRFIFRPNFPGIRLPRECHEQS